MNNARGAGKKKNADIGRIISIQMHTENCTHIKFHANHVLFTCPLLYLFFIHNFKLQKLEI